MKKIMSFLLLTVFMLPPTRISALSSDISMDSVGFNRNHKGVLLGFMKTMESIEDLLRGNGNDPVVGIQHLVEGVTRLIQVGIKENNLSIDDQLKIAMVVDGFRDQLGFLVKNYQRRGDESIDQEQQKMIEGLTTILYNLMYILIKPESIGTCLTNILGGIYKVISSVLADGRIDRNDWDRLLKALTSVFGLSHSEIENQLLGENENIVEER